MKHFLRLIRFPNILIIVITMLVIRYGLLLPMLSKNYSFLGVTMQLQLSVWQFVLLVCSTVFLSASGYIINDYFDVNADMLNKPDKVIIGTHISPRVAMLLHWIFNILGVVCGGIVSFSIEHPNFIMIFVFIAGLLWFYSTSFSKEPFIGNIIIAFLVAFVPLIEAVYELIPINFMYKNVMSDLYLSFEKLLFWSLGYSLFAFLLTLVREMVKDIEDLEGDAAYGRNTIPIAYGIKTAKAITIGVFSVTIISLIFVINVYLTDLFSMIYASVCIVLILLYSLYRFIKADDAKSYHLVSTILKISMLSGLIYIVLVNYIVG